MSEKFALMTTLEESGENVKKEACQGIKIMMKYLLLVKETAEWDYDYSYQIEKNILSFNSKNKQTFHCHPIIHAYRQFQVIGSHQCRADISRGKQTKFS